MISLLLFAGLVSQDASLPPSRSQPGKYESFNFGARPIRPTLKTWPGLLDDLARSQADDGGWGSYDDSRLGVTATALLAFLQTGVTTWALQGCVFPWGRGSSAGSIQTNKEGHRILRRGIDYILRHQGSDGFIGDPENSRALHDHAIAATVLSEAYGLGWLTVLRHPAEQAIHALEASSFPSLREDADAVGWIVLALRSATLSSLPFDRAVYDRLSPNLRSTVEGAVELLLWIHLGRVGKLPPGRCPPPSFPDLPSDTAADLFWGTKALLSFDGPEGPLRKRWKKRGEPPSPKEQGVEAMALQALTSTTRSEFWLWGAK